MLQAVKEDDYLRVLDLRKNKFSAKVLNDTTNYDFIKSLQENDSLTNIDLRDNDGYDHHMRFKLSLIMMRNIERLRQNGIMV